MASTQGFITARTKSGAPVGRMEEFSVSNGYATALYDGDPVAVSTTGYLKRAANTNTVVGIYRGCRYIDSATGEMRFGPTLPAGTSSGGIIDGVYTTPRAIVEAVDNATFFVAADASVTLGLVGQGFEVSLGAGDDVTKKSGVNLKTATATTSAAPTSSMVQIVNLVNQVGTVAYSTAGGASHNFTNATPLVEVRFLRTRSGATL
jgi:hypothetical protein